MSSLLAAPRPSAPQPQDDRQLSPLPWQAADFARLVRTVAAGALLISVGWVGSALTADVSRQLAWLALGALGLLVALVGGVFWLLDGLRSIRVAQAEVLRDLRAPGEMDVEVPPRPEVPVQRAGRFTADRMSLHHGADCVLLAGKAAREVGQREIVAGRLDACPACAA